MPEGDTIFRTASTIRRWMNGRIITAAESAAPNVAIHRVVGRRIDGVDAVGKHLLITFPGEPLLLLRTHMRMTGSWHVYSAADTWQRPRRQARLILEADDHLAVCFNAPIIDLIAESTKRPGTAATAAVGYLGPDILADSFDIERAYDLARARSENGHRAIGEVLLDQRVVAGIGNIYRCEALAAESISPWAALSAIDEATLKQVLLTAARLMTGNLGPDVSRTFEHGSSAKVYRRAQKPCLTCGDLIVSKAQGDQARTAYWCPTCQALP
jgi:endonuclease VIII